MRRLKTLKPVVEFTAENEAAAAKTLHDLSEKIQAAQIQLEELRRFRSQYAAQFQQQNRRISSLQLNEYQAFLAMLGRGIREQEEKLAQLRQAFATAQQHWREAYCRHKGIDKIHGNLLKHATALKERALQREMDDLASRKKKSQSK